MYVDFGAKIKHFEGLVEQIFDKYKDNGYFEDIEPNNIAVFIYKNSIKFVPIEEKERVEELLNIINEAERWKSSLEERTRKKQEERKKSAHKR